VTETYRHTRYGNIGRNSSHIMHSIQYIRPNNTDSTRDDSSNSRSIIIPVKYAGGRSQSGVTAAAARN